MITDLTKAPFPYAGGKRHAAAHVWAALGDVGHYVEPFAGSLAVLLCRPHLANRPYHSETVCDRDGLLVNAWRAIQLHPDATAEAASWPVSEIDQAARQLACVTWAGDREYERMLVDPTYCDPTIAGYWLYGMGTWIGFGFADGTGAWVERDGRLVKQPKAKRGAGIGQKRPHLNNNGQGVHRPQLREPGIGQKRPHLHDDGQGVHRPQLREPGIGQKRPHLHDDGQGVHHAGLREPGLHAPDWQFHPVTMPELRRWFAALSARLRHVRITCGDWKRILTPSASLTISCDKANPCGVFLDPPYADTAGRDMGLYTHDSGDVAHQARAWALKHGQNPLYRIVFAGYAGEHGTAFHDAGWTEIDWFRAGHLRGGYGQQGDDGHQQDRERLWLSPHCIQPAPAAPTLFDGLWDDDDAAPALSGPDWRDQEPYRSEDD